MKVTNPWLGSALVAVLAASAAGAQSPSKSAAGPPAPSACFFHKAPDACGPGYYAPNINGMWFGPNYDLHPPCGPFSGVLLRFGEKGELPPVTPNRSGVANKPACPAPGPYRGPTGGLALQGPSPAGPNKPNAIYGPGGLYGRYINGPGGAYALNFPAAPGPAVGPYGYAPYGPPGRMIPFSDGDGGQVVPGPVSFPTHPWARSPRDFFMEGDDTAYPVAGGYGLSPRDYGPAPLPTQPVYAPPPALPPEAPMAPRPVPQ